MKDFFRHLAMPIVFLLAFAAMQIGITMATQAVWGLLCDEPSTGAVATIVSMAAFSVAVIVLFLCTRWASVSGNYVRTRPWATLFWCVLAAFGSIIPFVWLQEQMPALPDIVAEQLGEVIKNRWGYLVIGILAPFAEELVFRGAILRALLAWGKNHWLMIGISALLFAIIHANPAQMPHAFAGGLLLGWMYYRTGSIVPGMVFHWVNNSVAYVVYNILPDPNAPLTALFNGNDTAVWLSVLFSLCIFIPSLFQLAMRMKRAGQPE